MFRFHADFFAESWRAVEFVRANMEHDIHKDGWRKRWWQWWRKPRDPDATLHPKLLDYLGRNLPKLRESLVVLDLGYYAKTLDHTIENLSELTSRALLEHLRILQHNVESGFAEQCFMFIPAEDAKWFEKKDVFGPAVSQAFASARKTTLRRHVRALRQGDIRQ